MNVLVVGGTGFVGYHAVLELQRRGHQLTVLALPPLPAPGLLPSQVRLVLGNLDNLADTDLTALLHDQQGLVFAAGVDDRYLPDAPADDFFYNGNVRPVARLFALARQAGVQRGVVTGSYFSYFDRQHPEWRLCQYHPYINSRRQQAEAAFQAGLPGMQVMVLELPYIFGAMPGRTPMWAPLIDYIRQPVPLFYPRGGTNAISVQRVAEAISGALEQGQGGEHYTVGDENLTWADLLARLGRFAGRQKPVHTVPDGAIRLALRLVDFTRRLRGKQGGLDLAEFARLQTMNAFFDPVPAQQALGFKGGGLNEALQATVQACLAAKRA